eukprot:scaffold2620_cov143-Skeletonema_menzelii.AAC.9
MSMAVGAWCMYIVARCTSCVIFGILKGGRKIDVLSSSPTDRLALQNATPTQTQSLATSVKVYQSLIYSLHLGYLSFCLFDDLGIWKKILLE